MNRLLDKYKADVIPALTQKFSYKNIMQVPKLDKIVINIAAGDSIGNSKALDNAINNLIQLPVKKGGCYYVRKINYVGVHATE